MIHGALFSVLLHFCQVIYLSAMLFVEFCID